MAKTVRLLNENLKLIDVVIELIDARIPLSSKNPQFDNLIKNKPRILAANKEDLADPQISEKWRQWYIQKGFQCVFVNSVTGKGIKQLKSLIREATKEKVERLKQKGIRQLSIKIMAVGIPNVGKSSFLNNITGKGSAKTGNKPGVTKGKQWIRINSDMDLLDTPGVLWPKFEDNETGFKLAVTGAIRDEIFDTQQAALKLLRILMNLSSASVEKRYSLNSSVQDEGFALLEQAGKKRGCIMSGGLVDLARAASLVIDDFRSGRLGRITLENPLCISNNK